VIFRNGRICIVLNREEERAQISEAWAVAKWPTLKPIKRVKDPPEMAKNAAKEDVFEFRNEDGDVVMLQVRCAGPQGKSYVPFTYWSDDKWRSCEADGPLPLYNADKIKGNATVFIHEGAKGARYCQGLIESNSVEAKAHPWRKERGSSAINLHVPTSIKAHAGDAGPFLDFMKYMFNDEEELKHVLKWCATLIARPSIRMGYGLLLISEQQGIGKTTLGAHILAPLVGLHNTSFPGENDITSAFNEWVAHKRLAVISEIYSGSSWRAYHALKSVITDREVTVNQKYMRQYVVENWCHVLASSNSMRALKMENDDRRWLYPEMAEVPWPREKFDFFRAWLTTGGLGIIKGWAEEWGDYVAESDRAPMTARKMEMIEGSRSEAQSEALDIARTVAGLGRAGGVAIKDVIGWVRAHAQGRVFDSDYELRRAMTDGGLLVYPKRLRIGNRVQVVLINEELSKGVGGLPLTEANELVRNSIVRCADVMESSM
jgi:hypothetical protein